MLMLPHGNRCSQITVIPKDWKKQKKITRDWQITYRFYSEGHKIKQVTLRGMNIYKNVLDRIAFTRALIEQELHALLIRGYNPNLQNFIPVESHSDIGPDVPFIQALKYVFNKTTCTPENKKNIKSVLKKFNNSMVALNYDRLKVGEVRRKHVRLILDNIELSDNNYNNHRRYMSGLFSQLMELDAIEFNPVQGIKKRKTVRRIKQIFTAKDRLVIDQLLKKKGMMAFRLYMRIFFHSGCRSTELLSLKAKDVNLNDGFFVITQKKGSQKKELKKTIKDNSLRYWKLALKNADPEDYVFGRLLKPGKVKINAHQISRRWVTVKKETGITSGFYSLKHTHTTEVVDISDTQTAAMINGHTSTAMVVNIYDTKTAKREHERIKKLTNSFI